MCIRDRIRSAPTSDSSVIDAVPPAVPDAAEAPKYRFFFLPDVEPDAVDEQDLHNLMKLWRHGRATRTLGQVLQDSYVCLLYTSRCV